MDKQQIYEYLKKYNQEHLLTFVDNLESKEQAEFVEKLSKIDFEEVKSLYENREEILNDNDVIEPMKFVDRTKLSEEEKEEYTKLGEQIISSGKYATVTMAGGQGTRLGHNGPKGTFMIGTTPDKSLFECVADTLKLAKAKYDVYMPWYIMTSRENNDDTVAFFEANNYFDYPKENVVFFKQSELPMLDTEGKILLEEKYKIREAANGSGGVFEAINKNGILEDMKKRNIEWIFIGGIDNILLNIVDPLFVGMAEKSGLKMASKTLVKAYPLEKIGSFCKRNGRPSVIEYTEISDEMAHMTDENGELLYGESHVLCNLFSIEALELVKDERLPYHTAFKKSSYIDTKTGENVEPDSPNAYKFEAFIFDAFSKVEDMLLLRSIREREFAPIKNKEGVDSPETARKLYNAYWNKN